MSEVYRVATYEEVESRHIRDYSSLLLGPNGFECQLTDPEDRNWHRDGKTVVAELNRLAAENAKLESDNDRLRGRVEILRDKIDTLKGDY